MKQRTFQFSCRKPVFIQNFAAERKFNGRYSGQSSSKRSKKGKHAYFRVTENSRRLCTNPPSFPKFRKAPALQAQKPADSVAQKTKRVAVVGVSGRALAEAIAEAGAHPCVFDSYGDVDTLAATQPSPDIPPKHAFLSFDGSGSWRQQLEDQAHLLRRCDAIILTGGVENRPKLLDHLTQLVSGTEAARWLPKTDSIRKLRSPSWLAQVAQSCGVGFPETLALPDADSSSTSSAVSMNTRVGRHESERQVSIAADQREWLVKSTCGSGGLAVRELTTEEQTRKRVLLQPDEYIQERIDGHCRSAVWLAADRVRLLGVTDSLSASDWPGPTEFIYRGSFGPIRSGAQQHQQLESLGAAISSKAGYKGLLQCDFVQDGDGSLFLLEVNPRWTAGMELLHRAGINPAAELLQRGDDRSQPVRRDRGRSGSNLSDAVYCKAVCYAQQEFSTQRDWATLTQQLSKSQAASSQAACAENIKLTVHDIPDPSTTPSIPEGHPICTLVAETSRKLCPQTDSVLRDKLLHQLEQACGHFMRNG